MDRVAGIETEYGCLVSNDESRAHTDAWPVRVKNYLFRKAQAGAIDLHYRDYEEPPGNGGFLLNGGRLFLHIGHNQDPPPQSPPLPGVVTHHLPRGQPLPPPPAKPRAAPPRSFINKQVGYHTPGTFGRHR